MIISVFCSIYQAHTKNPDNDRKNAILYCMTSNEDIKHKVMIDITLNYTCKSFSC